MRSIIRVKNNSNIININRFMDMAEYCLLERPVSYQSARMVELLFDAAEKSYFPLNTYLAFIKHDIKKGRIAAAELAVWCIQRRVPLGNYRAFQRSFESESRKISSNMDSLCWAAGEITNERWTDVQDIYRVTVLNAFPDNSFSLPRRHRSRGRPGHRRGGERR